MKSKLTPIVFGIIPAKGMSTGLPGKNMRIMAGHPMIHYMLKSALSSIVFDEVWVSTENDQIEEYCLNQGARVLRHDPSLSSETSPTFGVISNILNHWKKGDKKPDIVVLMRATSPLCLSLDIKKAVETLIDSTADSVVAVTRSDIHPHRVLTIGENGFLTHFDPDSPEKDYPVRRQKLGPVYIRTGAVYATRREVIEGGSLWGTKALPYIMPKERALNVNDEIDFLLAEKLLGI